MQSVAGRRIARLFAGIHLVAATAAPLAAAVPTAAALTAVTLLTAALTAAPASAHRLSPAYFGLSETADGSFAAQWKVSISGGLADVLEPRVPEGCSIEGAVRPYVVDDARVLHATIRCDGALPGREFTVDGLAATDTDVLLRIDYADGGSFTHRLVPTAATVLIPEAPGVGEVITTYLVLGIEHILLGIDHLLFVLALLLLVHGFARLVATITAFTVAHSVTLGAATLGWVQVPGAAVEATIALSILFLATELARRAAGTSASAPAGAPAVAAAGVGAPLPPEPPITLAIRYPWLVAFAFGLLHGFGFAGALSEVGLPAQAIPLALLFFNIGVEIGQVMFVAAVLAAGWLLRRVSLAPPRWAPRAAAYVIGSLAAFWVCERTLAVF